MNFLRSLWYRYKEWRYERKCIKHLGIKPTKMYVTEEQYDALMDAINNPPDLEKVERLREIMNKKAPWDELWETKND